jgi:hypothetical protein
VRGGFLENMPAMPKMPKIGRKKAKPMRRDDYEAVLAAAAPSAQLAFELIAFGGLRPCEVRGLRWPDVDLQARTLTIRRAVTDGEETTPKSHHAEVLPLSPRVGGAASNAETGSKEPLGYRCLDCTRAPLGGVWAEPSVQAGAEAHRQERLDGAPAAALLRDGALPERSLGRGGATAGAAQRPRDHAALRRRGRERPSRSHRATRSKRHGTACSRDRELICEHQCGSAASRRLIVAELIVPDASTRQSR